MSLEMNRQLWIKSIVWIVIHMDSEVAERVINVGTEMLNSGDSIAEAVQQASGVGRGLKIRNVLGSISQNNKLTGRVWRMESTRW
jgi:hypothetical protein